MKAFIVFKYGKSGAFDEGQSNKLSAKSKNDKSCRRAKDQTNVNRTNILVIGTRGSAGVMAALRTVWKPWASQEFEFAEVVLRKGEAAIRAGLHSAMARCQPDLLLLCAAGNQTAEADHVLKELQNKLLETPLLLALDADRGEPLPNFLQMAVIDFVVAPFRECELLPKLRRWHRKANDGSMGLSELKRKLGLG
jgi:hypothetical protein